ncbi:MAG: right-handed parallel beta-helix repeat-containing protein, partial [Pseudomonadota bacterium]|nr:right-handed parallel beta-helix repeat-containing protein [Pseudomonadota bacterium]
MTSRTRIAAPILIALAAVTLPLSAQQQAPFSVAETGRGYATLQDAVDAIGAGTGTVVFAPGTYNECAVQRAGDITYRAMEPGSATLSGVACEGKGALVLGGEAATVIGLVFSDIAVPDRNGAGIRLESGDLAVTQSWFRDSEQGILTAHDPNIHLRIDKSTFTRLGTCEGDGGCAHSIYTGEIAETAVTRSRFEAGLGGHYLKSRAARTIVEDSSFDDAAGRGTNYMIDLPNGGNGRIVRNWFVQGRDKENWSAFIAVGAE